MAAEEQEQHVDGQLPEEPQATEEHAAPEGLEEVADDDDDGPGVS
jgi:hypothetical protein